MTLFERQVLVIQTEYQLICFGLPRKRLSDKDLGWSRRKKPGRREAHPVLKPTKIQLAELTEDTETLLYELPDVFDALI